MKFPSSRANLKLSVAPFDLGWAVVAPIIALVARDPLILSAHRVGELSLYWAVSVGCAVLAFVVFRIRDGLASYFSVQDAFDVVKAAVLANLLLLLVLFMLTRLDGVPRSTPLIQALVLVAGLIAARAFTRIAHSGRNFERRPPSITSENIVMIGASQLTSLYLKLLRAYLPGHHRVIGILDEKPNLVGRKIAGVPVTGTPNHLEALISEYAVHGIRTDRVLVGGDPDLLSTDALKEVQRVCGHWGLTLDFVPQLMGLWGDRNSPVSVELVAATPSVTHLPRYLRWKPALDLCACLILMIVLSPLYLLAAALVLIDVGQPLLFWQQRLGLGGRTFLLHKFRTLRPPFDWQGRPIPDDQRISAIGRFLRKTRLDELPQLFNVLVGEMALVGPRPLLPEDQPGNAAVRLLVRPGITGWAQVNGGKLLSADEKHLLDEWYIQNASLGLDLKILLATLKVMFVGERRSHLVKQPDDQLGRPADGLTQDDPAERYKRVG